MNASRIGLASKRWRGCNKSVPRRQGPAATRGLGRVSIWWNRRFLSVRPRESGDPGRQTADLGASGPGFPLARE